MYDKKHDPFFDEENQEKTDEKDLLSMLDGYQQPRGHAVKPGAKIKGVVSRVTAEGIFVDLDGKNQGFLAIRAKDESKTPDYKIGDPVEAFIASIENNEITLTTTMSGATGTSSQLIEAMKGRMPVEGKVTGVNKGGLQVKIMGQRAFCPMGNIELKYVEDVNVYLNKNLTFMIERVTEGGRNIVVSRVPILEEEMEKKMLEFEAGIAAKTVRSGTVSRIADFGLFVDMGGIDGLVHISEISWHRAENLAESFSIGQKVEFVVLKIERKDSLRNAKISLSIKQAGADPWTTVSEKFSVGSQVAGTITRLANFGAFVELTPGIEGLIHVSEMSWGKRINHPQDVVKVGDQVNVTILAVDENKRTISCTLKDVKDDPWTTIVEKFPVGAVVKGTVASQTKFGYFVDLDSNFTGLLVFSNIAADRKAGIRVGSEIEVSIDRLDLENRRIGLSSGVAAEKADEEFAKAYIQETKKAEAAEKPETEFAAKLKKALTK